MRQEDNSKFVQVMAGLIPRDLVLTVEADESPFASLSSEEKRAVAARLMEQIAAERAKVIDQNPIPHDLEHVVSQADIDKSST